MGAIIFLNGVEAEGGPLNHWLLLLAAVEVPLSQGLRASVEGHDQVFDRSDVLDGTPQGVTLTRQQRPIAVDKPD